MSQAGSQRSWWRGTTAIITALGTVGGMSTLGIEATRAALAEGQPWLDHALDFLATDRQILPEVLGRNIYLPPQATYLGWRDLRAYGFADAAAHLLEQAGVALTRGPDHGAAGTGFGSTSPPNDPTH